MWKGCVTWREQLDLVERCNSSRLLLFVTLLSVLFNMSQQGPPADAKQAQAAALQELEAAQRRKREADANLVCPS